MLIIKNAEQIREEIEEAMDNQPTGFVYDYDVVESGVYNGLEHNGVWMRIVKLSDYEYAYSYQNDSHDDDYSMGNIEAVAEWIFSCAEQESDKTDMYEVEYA